MLKINYRNEDAKNEIEIAQRIASIISKLISARNDMNLTQAELAEKCGLKQSAIARMENLNVSPRIDTIIRVAKCLNVDIGIIEKESINVYYNINLNIESEKYTNTIKSFYTKKWGECVVCQE